MSYEILVGIGVGDCFVGILGYKGLELLIKKVTKNKLKESTNKLVGQETLDAIHLGLIQTANTLGLGSTEWYEVLEKINLLVKKNLIILLKFKEPKNQFLKKILSYLIKQLKSKKDFFVYNGDAKR